MIRDIYETGNICALKIRFGLGLGYICKRKKALFYTSSGLLPLSSIRTILKVFLVRSNLMKPEIMHHTIQNCRLHHCIHVHTIHTHTNTQMNLIRPVAWACPSMFTIVKHIARRKLQCCRFFRMDPFKQGKSRTTVNCTSTYVMWIQSATSP